MTARPSNFSRHISPHAQIAIIVLISVEVRSAFPEYGAKLPIAMHGLYFVTRHARCALRSSTCTPITNRRLRQTLRLSEFRGGGALQVLIRLELYSSGALMRCLMPRVELMGT